MSMEQARQKMQGFAVGQRVFLTSEKLDNYGWKSDDIIVIARLDEYDDDLTFKVRNTRTDITHWVSEVTADQSGQQYRSNTDGSLWEEVAVRGNIHILYNNNPGRAQSRAHSSQGLADFYTPVGKECPTCHQPTPAS